MTSKIKNFISQRYTFIILYSLLALSCGTQAILSKPKYYNGAKREYNQYNNYTIFEKSFYHLKDHQDLYKLYPDEQWDLYKYTPTFSVFFSVFAIFPDWVGLNLWNLMNVLLLLAAVYYLPYLSNYQKGLILLITMFELLTSVQNEQSNGLMAGLLIFAFAFLEKDKPLLATFCIVFSAFIKLFSIVGFVLFLFYPKKLKSILFSFIWTCILLLIPLVYIDLEQYKFLINSYLNLLSNDHSISLGYSVMGWLSTWFSLDINKNIIVLIGAIIFILPFSKVKMYKEVAFRYLALTSVLLWVIIFNHKAESPTFVIAVSGVAIWFILSKKNLLNYILFFSAIILTILSPTDLFPPFIRNEFFKPFVVKVVPCILIWLKIVYEMLAMKKDNLSNYPFLCFSKDSL